MLLSPFAENRNCVDIAKDYDAAVWANVQVAELVMKSAVETGAAGKNTKKKRAMERSPVAKKHKTATSRPGSPRMVSCSLGSTTSMLFCMFR